MAHLLVRSGESAQNYYEAVNSLDIWSCSYSCSFSYGLQDGIMSIGNATICRKNSVESIKTVAGHVSGIRFEIVSVGKEFHSILTLRSSALDQIIVRAGIRMVKTHKPHL